MKILYFLGKILYFLAASIAGSAINLVVAVNIPAGTIILVSVWLFIASMLAILGYIFSNWELLKQ